MRNTLGRVAVLLTAAIAVLFVVTSWPRPVPAYSIVRTPAYQDTRLLAMAWRLPVARHYAAAGLVYQANPSSCGPTSIADLLRSEGKRVTPAQVLDGSGIASYFGVLPGGVTLDQEATLLRRMTGRSPRVLRGLSLTAFRAEMARGNDPALRIIVNFTREPLFGTGHGHFSPILGYLPDRDLVFVGDVNGNYRPWLAPVTRLYAAQDTIDPATGAKRGLLEIAAR